MMRRLLLVILGLVICSDLKSQNNDLSDHYSQAMSYLKGESALGKLDRCYSKVKVSSQVVPFDVLGWFFQSELSERVNNYQPQASFREDDYLTDERFKDLSDLKRKSKCQVFFTEARGDLLVAEILSDATSSDYLSASMFGEGDVYLFEYKDGDLMNVLFKRVNHN